MHHNVSILWVLIQISYRNIRQNTLNPMQFLFLSELVRSVCFRRRFKILSQKTTWVVLTWGNGTSFSLIAPNRYVWYTYKMFSTCFIKKKILLPQSFKNMPVYLNADSCQTAMLKISNVWHLSNISACVQLKWIKMLNIPRK